MDNMRRFRSAFCLMVLLQITAGSSEQQSVIVREGKDVTLPSGSRTGNQETCHGVNWDSVRHSNTVNLVTDGQLTQKALDSKRLALTANCSLVLTKVMSEDSSVYHFEQGEVRDQIPLSVVSLSEQEEGDQVAATCSVSSPDYCRHKMRWINGDTKTPESLQCSVTHWFPTSSFNLSKCEVTDGYTSKKHLFEFSPRSTNHIPGEFETRAPTTTSTTNPTTTTERGGQTKTGSVLTTLKDWWLIIVAAVVTVVFLITIVLIIRWKRTKGKKTKSTDSTELSLNLTVAPQDAPGTSLNTEDPETDVSYASVSYTKKKKEIKAQTQNIPEDGDTVTYSTLKVSSSTSSPPPAAADSSSIYATVRKTT